MEEKREKEHVAVECSQVQDVVALAIYQVWIGAMLQEEIDNVVMTPLGSPHGWSRNGFAADCVDVGASLDKKLT